MYMPKLIIVWKINTFLKDRDVGDESGWKQIHGDVFRAPPHLLLFSALVGTGHQLSLLVFSVIMFSIIGTYYRT